MATKKIKDADNQTFYVSGVGTGADASNPFVPNQLPGDGTNSVTIADGAMKVNGSAYVQPVSGTFWQAVQPVSGTFWQALQPVSIASSVAITAASLPLATNAATESTLAALNTKINTCNTNSVGITSSVLPTGAATSAKQPNLGTAGLPSTDFLSVQGGSGMTALKVDGSAVTQPVSGTFWQAVQPVSGTLTIGSLASGTNTIGKVDQGAGGVSAWKVDGSAVTQPVSGTFFQATQPVSIAAVVPVSATALPLPTGAATLTAQNTGNTSLASIDGKLVAVNTGAVTVTSTVLPAGASTEATLAALNAKVATVNTGAVTVASSALPTGAATAAKQPALGTAGTPSADYISVQGGTGMTALKVDGSAVTQPVSNASLPLPAGASTSALQTTGNSSLSSIDGKITAVNTGAVTISTALPAGSNLIGSVNNSQINGVTPLMGNGVTGTGSQRVTIASDNAAFTVNVAQSGTWNVTNISGTVSLPTGAATAAKQPALGTAGTASADVLSMQGIASGTPLAVGGQMTEIQNSPAVTASIYTAGNCLGAKQTLANAVRVAAGSGMIQSVLMTDKAKQNVNTTITFFTADPTSSTFTDKAAMTVNVADLTKIVATVTINSFVSYSGNSVGIATGLAIPFKLPSGTTLYAVAMTNGTPTPTSTSDVTFIYEILWD